MMDEKEVVRRVECEVGGDELWALHMCDALVWRPCGLGKADPLANPLLKVDSTVNGALALVRGLMYHNHQTFLNPLLKSARVPESIVLFITAVYLAPTSSGLLHVYARDLITKFLAVYAIGEPAAVALAVAQQWRISKWWHMDGRWVEQIVRSFPSDISQRPRWLLAVRQVFSLAAHNHIGATHLAAIPPTRSDDPYRLERLAAFIKSANKSNSGDQTWTYIVEFLRIVSAVAEFRRAMIHQFATVGATELSTILEYVPPPLSLVEACKPSPHVHILFANDGLAGGNGLGGSSGSSGSNGSSFWSTGAYKDMSYRVETKVDAATVDKYNNFVQQVEKTTKLIQSIVPKLILPHPSLLIRPKPPTPATPTASTAEASKVASAAAAITTLTATLATPQKVTAAAGVPVTTLTAALANATTQKVGAAASAVVTAPTAATAVVDAPVATVAETQTVLPTAGTAAEVATGGGGGKGRRKNKSAAERSRELAKINEQLHEFNANNCVALPTAKPAVKKTLKRANQSATTPPTAKKKLKRSDGKDEVGCDEKMIEKKIEKKDENTNGKTNEKTNGKTNEKRDEKKERAEKVPMDVYLLWMWHAKSLVKTRLLSDCAKPDGDWRVVSPLPLPTGVDVAGSLHAQLGLQPAVDPLTKAVKLEGAPDVEAYIYRRVYANDRANDRTLQPEFLKRVTEAFEAMVGVGDVQTHQDLLATPGLRAYYLELWRSTVLTGKRVITPASLAFVNTALVYCLDSLDPLDHDDYRSIFRILQCYTDRQYAPADFKVGTNKSVCLHAGQRLSSVHPLPPSALRPIHDTTISHPAPILELASMHRLAFAPRLLRWLISSQRLNTTKTSESEGRSASVDQYPVDRISPATKQYRWQDISSLCALFISTLFQPMLQSTLDDSFLSTVDMLRISLSSATHNRTVRQLLSEWKEHGLTHTPICQCHTDHPDQSHDDDPSGGGHLCYCLLQESKGDDGGKRPHDIWPGIRNNEFNLVGRRVQEELAELVGDDSLRIETMKSFATIKTLIYHEPKLTNKQKINQSMFAMFLSVALDHMPKNRFEKRAPSAIADIRQIDKRSGRYKVIYVPKTSLSASSRIKVNTPADAVKAEKIQTIVQHYAQVHKWRYRHKIIQQTGEEHGLLAPDPNQPNQPTNHAPLNPTNYAPAAAATAASAATEKPHTKAVLTTVDQHNNWLGTTQSKLLTEEQARYLQSTVLHQTSTLPPTTSVANVDVATLVHGSISTK